MDITDFRCPDPKCEYHMKDIEKVDHIPGFIAENPDTHCPACGKPLTTISNHSVTGAGDFGPAADGL